MVAGLYMETCCRNVERVNVAWGLGYDRRESLQVSVFRKKSVLWMPLLL